MIAVKVRSQSGIRFIYRCKLKRRELCLKISILGFYIQPVLLKDEHEVKVFSDMEISKVLSPIDPLLERYSKMERINQKRGRHKDPGNSGSNIEKRQSKS